MDVTRTQHYLHMGKLMMLFVLVGMVGCGNRESDQGQAPALNMPSLAAKAPQVPALNVRYSDLMAKVTPMFPAMEPSTLSTGEERTMGKSATGAAILEVVGSDDVVVRATLSFFASSDNNLVNLENISGITRFMQGVLPEWPEGTKTVFSMVKRLADAPVKAASKEQIVEHGNVRVTVGFIRPLAMFYIRIANRATQAN